MVYYAVISKDVDDEHGDEYFITVSYKHKTKKTDKKLCIKTKWKAV